MDFSRDDGKMNHLFEAFLLNFYRKEFPQWTVRSEQLEWKFTTHLEINRSYLPRMITDISIETENGRIIIDAKYYSKTLSSRFDSEKINSGNLYQLFSYLLNQRSLISMTKRTRGNLLYPTVDKELDMEYWYEDHPIQIKTVNLNMSWKLIDARLRNIVNE